MHIFHTINQWKGLNIIMNINKVAIDGAYPWFWDQNMRCERPPHLLRTSSPKWRIKAKHHWSLVNKVIHQPLFKRYFPIVTNISNHHIQLKYVSKSDMYLGYISKLIQTTREMIPRMCKQCKLPSQLSRSNPPRHCGVLGECFRTIGEKVRTVWGVFPLLMFWSLVRHLFSYIIYVLNHSIIICLH